MEQTPVITTAMDFDEGSGLLWLGFSNGSVVGTVLKRKVLYCRFTVDAPVLSLSSHSTGVWVATEGGIQYHGNGGMQLGPVLPIPHVVCVTALPDSQDVIVSLRHDSFIVRPYLPAAPQTRINGAGNVRVARATDRYVIFGHLDGRVSMFTHSGLFVATLPIDGAVSHLEITQASPLTVVATLVTSPPTYPLPAVTITHSRQGLAVTDVTPAPAVAGVHRTATGLVVAAEDASVSIIPDATPSAPMVVGKPAPEFSPRDCLTSTGLVVFAAVFGPTLMVYVDPTRTLPDDVPAPTIPTPGPTMQDYGLYDLPTVAPEQPFPTILPGMVAPDVVSAQTIAKTTWQGDIGYFKETRVEPAAPPPSHLRLTLADFTQVSHGKFDFSAANVTPLCGLERASDLAFVNPILQLLAATPGMSAALATHPLCAEPLCPPCEVGCALDGMALSRHFLPSNLLRAMRLHPSGEHLGFSGTRMPLPRRVMAALLFIVSQLVTVPDAANLIGITRVARYTCPKCGESTEKVTVAGTLDLTPDIAGSVAPARRTVHTTCPSCGVAGPTPVLKSIGGVGHAVLVTMTEWGRARLPSSLTVNGVDLQLAGVGSIVHEAYPTGSKPSHAIAHVALPGGGWAACNDFTISSVPVHEVLSVGPWREPFAAVYTRPGAPPTPTPAPIPPSIVPGLTEYLAHSPRIAIDMEFVELAGEVTHYDADGLPKIDSLPELALGRVSAVTVDGPVPDTTLLDCYVASAEPVTDYLTPFSGLKEGDLKEGRPGVRSLKDVYRTVRAMRDAGAIFVGHGLAKDFGVLNLAVPASQIIDTVTICHLPGQRSLALRYLAKALLDTDIQQVTHDSIEDAVTAARVLRVVTRLKEEGRWEERLRRLYDEGPACRWGRS